MLPIFQICVPPMNPATADKTVIASWIIFFQTLVLSATIQQFNQVENRPLYRYKRTRRSNERILNLPEQRAHFAQP